MENVDRVRPLFPEHLSDRLRMDGDRILNGDGQFILYWMHHSLRGHENPALDVALVAAEQLRLPIFVYQGLSEQAAF